MIKCALGCSVYETTPTVDPPALLKFDFGGAIGLGADWTIAVPHARRLQPPLKPPRSAAARPTDALWTHRRSAHRL
jgi:hypothetical protein